VFILNTIYPIFTKECLMKIFRLLTAAVVCLSLLSCAPWDQIGAWKKCAVISVTGNPVIGKTENTAKREAGNTIAQVKNAVKESGGKALNHSLQPVIDACGTKLSEKLGSFGAIPFMKSDEVLANAKYTAMESDVDSKAKTEAGKNLQKATENWDTRPVPAAGYKILNSDQITQLYADLGVDGQIAVSINFMYDLQGLGTLGSAKGVAEVTFTAIDKGEKGTVSYSVSYAGESDGKCDVKSGGFFEGEAMDPLLIQAFEKAVDNFTADAAKKLAKAKKAA
jgi:hypothetical protein